MCYKVTETVVAAEIVSPEKHTLSCKKKRKALLDSPAHTNHMSTGLDTFETREVLVFFQDSLAWLQNTFSLSRSVYSGNTQS